LERLDIVRYVIIGGSLAACFINLVDEINKGASLLQILFYSGILLAVAVLLILIDKKIVIPIVCIIIGFAMLLDDLIPGRLSAAISALGYGTFLANNKYVNYAIYLAVSTIVIASHVFKTGSPEDLINILIGYAVFFALNELIYRQRQENVKTGG
jgi:hypothetical protein